MINDAVAAVAYDMKEGSWMKELEIRNMKVTKMGLYYREIKK